MASKGRAITRRQPTERSGQVVSHVDAIEKYNARLSSLLDKEKSKDDAMRTLEKQLYADKLKHAELIADVSLGHELMEVEEAMDGAYTAATEEFDAVCAPLREAVAAYEEVSARLSLLDVEGVMLQAQVQAAKSREDTLLGQHDTMASKLETLKSNEKAADTRAKALAAKCKALQASHGKAFDGRHANAKDRKNAPEIAALVEEAQQKRREHHVLMKKLHAKEAQEIRLFEEEAAAKLAAAEHKLQSQFTKEELKAVSKHDAYQRELKSEMDRLEEKMKTQMEEEEKAMRDKLKKLNQQNAKSSHAIETMRQQVVDYLAERNVHATQIKHLEALSAERAKTFEKLTREESVLKADLATNLAAAKAVHEQKTKTAAKYALVMKTNKKLSGEIDKYRALVSKGETELHISPPNKRIRLHQDKLA